MSGDSIAGRLEDCIKRQVELFERMAAAQALPSEDAESIAGDDALRLQEEFTRKLTALEQEFWILKREWDKSANVSQSARERIRQAASAAHELAEEIARTKERDGARISEMVRDTQVQWGTLRRGKRMVRSLRAGERGDGGFIDRKA